MSNVNYSPEIYQKGRELVEAGHQQSFIPFLNKVVLMDKQECVFVEIHDICYVEASGAYTNVFLANGKKIFVSKPIKHFVEKLPSTMFFRSHKSFLINLECIVKYVKTEGGYLMMKDGKSIPVSVRRRDEIMKLLENVII